MPETMRQMTFFEAGDHRLQIALGDDGLVYLTAFSGDFPINLSSVVNSHRALAWITEVCCDQPGPSLVPLAKLDQLRRKLRQAKLPGVVVQVAPEVAELKLVTPAKAPVVSYVWSADEQKLLRDRKIRYQGSGWLLAGNRFWQWDDSSAWPWLGKEELSGTDLLPFLRDVLPGWQRSGWQVNSDLGYSDRPLQVFTVDSANVREINLSVRPIGRIDASRLPGLPGVVLAGNLLRPGLVMADLPGQWLSEDRLLLQGEQIPAFLQLLADQQCLLCDTTGQMQAEHRLYSAPARLLLSEQREENRGIGIVNAVPTWQVQDLCLPAIVVSQRLESAEQFVRLPHGWVQRAAVEDAGIGRFGRAENGYALSPISLTPMEILWRGSPRLEGPWSGLGCSPLNLPSGDDPEQVARLHLDFLVKLGMPGGLLGSINRYASLMFTFLQEFNRQQQGRARILIVGTKTMLNHLSRMVPVTDFLRLDQQPLGLAPGNCPVGLIGLTPSWLEKSSGLEQVDWDIICVLGVDSLVKSRSSSLFRQLRRLHKLLFLGLFGDLGFRQRSAARQAIADLMELEAVGPQLLWRFLLRNPEEAPRELIPPRAAGKDGHAPRTGTPAPTAGQTLGRSYLLTYQAEKAVEAARYVDEQLRGQQISPVPFVEYYQLRPSMSSMNSQQLAWYIYWRAEVRQGHYPDTGLDYINLLAIELINRAGGQSALDGYQLLRALWLHYRSAFPSLDNSLLPWLADYILDNRLPIDPLAPYDQAAALGAVVPTFDLLLQQYVGRPWLEVPYHLIVRLSNYHPGRSRFLQSGQTGVWERAVCSAMAAADDYYRQQYGQGIWQFFRPRRYRLEKRCLFQNAAYQGSSRLINFGSALPYGEQAALRALVTAVLKHSENVLRQRFAYRGKLRADPLPTGLADLITRAVSRVATVKPTPKRITIDSSQVQRLIAQSDEVRDLLLGSQSQPAEAAADDGELSLDGYGQAVADRNQDPSTADDSADPAGGSGEDWVLLFASLNKAEILALTYLAHGEEKTNWREFCLELGELPDLLIDRINSTALETIGDLLLDTGTGQATILPEYLSTVAERLELTRC